MNVGEVNNAKFPAARQDVAQLSNRELSALLYKILMFDEDFPERRSYVMEEAAKRLETAIDE